MPAVTGNVIAPGTSAAGSVVRPAALYPAVLTVRASTDYNTSTTSTATADVFFAGALGAIIGIDVTAIAASSAGGGTGNLTHTVQLKDPIGATYVGTTGVVTATTAVALYMIQCYPGANTLAPTSAVAGRFDLALTTAWRINTTSSSSATNWTYSISATPLPLSGSSS